MLSLDKENATSVTTGTRNGKQVDGVGVCPTLVTCMATPKNNLNKLAMTTTGNTTGKRRALCEVTLNTANRTGMGVTPKFERTSVVAARALGDFTKPAVSKRLVDATPKIVPAADEDLEPIERFIGSKFDSFDDIFPDGRLSEMFLGKKVNYVVKLTQGKRSAPIDEDDDDEDINSRQRKFAATIHEYPESSQMKAAMKKMEEQETLVELELPPTPTIDDEPGDSLLDLLDELNI